MYHVPEHTIGLLGFSVIVVGAMVGRIEKSANDGVDVGHLLLHTKEGNEVLEGSGVGRVRPLGIIVGCPVGCLEG